MLRRGMCVVGMVGSKLSLGRRGLAALALIAVLFGATAAQAYGLGSRIKPFVLSDQNGKQHRVDERTRVIIVARDAQATGIVEEALARGGKQLLAKHRAVYVADVSRMPGFLRNLITIPRLKGRPYPTLLDTDGSVVSQLPTRSGYATLIFLHNLRIAAVEHVAASRTLAPALASPKRFANY